MKNFIKHLFLLCLFGMISMGAKAEDIPNNEIWYTSINGETVTPYNSGVFGADIESNTYNGKGIIKFKNNVTSIGNYAFSGCEDLTSVTIPNSVTSIGDLAFYGCSGLTNVTIPNSVTEIESHAFWGCKGLTSVTIPNSVTSIGESAFGYCSGLTSVTIPESVTSIGQYAFSNCSGLTSIEIPNSVISIECSAFSDCSSLTSVTIPNSVTSIGDLAFYLCSSLTSVTIPESVTSIGDYAFGHCSSLTSVTIPNSVTSIGYYAFQNCLGLRNVTIGSSVESISDIAFYECYLLSFVNNSKLDAEAHKYWGATICDHITSDGLCIKDNTVMKYVGNVSSITIPNYVTSIGDDAFYECSGLTSVTIPESVTSIGHSAFSYCSGLTSVNITDLDKWAEIEFDYYANPLDNAHNLYLKGELVTEAKLTNAKKISDFAFSGCSSLTSIEIPNSVTSIGSSAFEGCSGLKSVTIGKSVTSIGNEAFYKCKGLTSIEIPNSVISIGRWAFSDCSSLTSVTIGNSVTSIGDRAFNNCSGLTSVTIGNSVTSIGDRAFNNCSGLKNIIAEGISAPNIDWYCFESVTNCILHVPLGSEESYTSNFGDWFGESNSYGNTIETYSAYSKSNAGEYSFVNWKDNPDVELSEGIEKIYVPVEATVGSLQYKRTFNNTDWQALYVPFELDVKTDLADFDVYEISTSSADAINVTLMTEGNTSANTPYLIKAKTTGEKAISVSSKIVKVTEENTNSELSDFKIVGTYEKLNYGDIAGDWYALKGGKFMKAGEGAYLNPYRFYLKHKSSSSKESIEINFNEPTGITLYENDNDNDNENGVIYNLNGMRVDSNYKGIVIINGKKYLKK